MFTLAATLAVAALTVLCRTAARPDPGVSGNDDADAGDLA